MRAVPLRSSEESNRETPLLVRTRGPAAALPQRNSPTPPRRRLRHHQPQLRPQPNQPLKSCTCDTSLRRFAFSSPSQSACAEQPGFLLLSCTGLFLHCCCTSPLATTFSLGYRVTPLHPTSALDSFRALSTEASESLLCTLRPFAIAAVIHSPLPSLDDEHPYHHSDRGCFLLRL